MRIVLALLCVVVFPGCATLVTGTTQAITIETDPAGAACTVTRGGEKLAALGATPGQVTIDKGFKTIDIACQKERYRTGATALDASLQPVIFGNILIGGGLGIIIDLTSGAAMRYETTTHVTLVPATFASPAARDEWFLRRRAAIEAEAAAASAETLRRCHVSACDQLVAEVEAKKTKRLAELDNHRAAAGTRDDAAVAEDPFKTNPLGPLLLRR